LAARAVYLFGESRDTFHQSACKIRRAARTNAVRVIVANDLPSIIRRYGARAYCVEITRRSVPVFAVAPTAKEFLLVAGAEREGLPDHVLQAIPRHIHVPMHGLNSSMNVSTAVAICGHVLADKQLKGK
jgi:tRNA G18 (ribose-2'-O)-methylase SpoU